MNSTRAGRSLGLASPFGHCPVGRVGSVPGTPGLRQAKTGYRPSRPRRQVRDNQVFNAKDPKAGGGYSHCGRWVEDGGDRRQSHMSRIKVQHHLLTSGSSATTSPDGGRQACVEIREAFRDIASGSVAPEKDTYTYAAIWYVPIRLVIIGRYCSAATAYLSMGTRQEGRQTADWNDLEILDRANRVSVAVNGTRSSDWSL